MPHRCFECQVIEVMERIERKLDIALRGGLGAAYDKEIQKDIDNLKASETALKAGIQNAESGQAAAPIVAPQPPA
jgi:cell division protein FtsB